MIATSTPITGWPMLPGMRSESKWLKVATGLVSDNPKPSRMVTPNSASKRRSTATGIGAPPDTPRRRVLATRSRRPSRAACSALSKPMNMVGTPQNTVTPCAAISCMAASGSKRGASTIIAPTATTEFICTVWPKVWNSGSAISCTSVLSSRVSATQHSALVTMLACESSAPLGVPVVPEV